MPPKTMFVPQPGLLPFMNFLTTPFHLTQTKDWIDLSSRSGSRFCSLGNYFPGRLQFDALVLFLPLLAFSFLLAAVLGRRPLWILRILHGQRLRVAEFLL